MDHRSRNRIAGTLVSAVFILAIVALAAVPAGAVNLDAPASSADAYGVLVDVKLLPPAIPVKQGPVSRASQDYPPGDPEPDEAHVASVGPLPSDGSLVNHIGAITSVASATGAPAGVASSEAADVSLLKSGGVSAITADLVRAQANSGCGTAPNATGTTFVNLKINGSPIDNTPAPNTVIDLTVAKVILNEQRAASDGRGIVVNAIHVISTTTGDPLFRGDIVVSHAASTVNCPGGPGSTGGNTEIAMQKTATPDQVDPGDLVTYTATISNSSSQTCLVTQFIEHLAQAFELVSTSGDLGASAEQVGRPGGGSDVMLGNGKTIPAGGTAHQTFVVRVKDDATPAVYFNNLEIYCANIGNFLKGLDAPVGVNGPTAPTPTPTTTSTATPTASPTASPEPDAKVLGRRLARTGQQMVLLQMYLLANLGGTIIGFGSMIRGRASAPARR